MRGSKRACPWIPSEIFWPRIYANERGLDLRSSAWIRGYFLSSPDPYPINLHLLRKDSAAVGIADEVSAHRDIEEDEEWSLKL